MNDALDQIITLHSQYQPSPATRQAIAGKTLVALIGPTGIGKSSLITAIVAQRPEYGVVTIVTTRDRKPEDPAGHKTGSEGITPERFLEMIQRGEVVEYAVNTNGQIYGQTAAGFPAQVNLMALLPSGLEPLSKAGFAKTIAIYLVTSGDDWRKRVEKSRTDYGDFDARLNEAIDSIEFAQSQSNELHFVRNDEGQQEAAVQTVLALIEGANTALDRTAALAVLNDMMATAIALKEA